jgi:hypothetical protein
LERSTAAGYLAEAEMHRRIRRGRPVWTWTKPIEPIKPVKKKTRPTIDIEEIIANMIKLHKQIAPFKDEKNQSPINTEKAEKSSVQNKEANEESSVQTEEDGEESCMQKEDAAYVGSVNDNVFRSCSHCSVNNTA